MDYTQCPSCYRILDKATISVNQHQCHRGRRRKRRHLQQENRFRASIFKPQGIPLKNNKIITLTPSELEAIRLKNLENLQQTEIAQKMSVSQSTLARILQEANKKIALALSKNYALKISEKE